MKIDGKWTIPIAEGKWSVSEIVSHIMFWDQHILSEISKQIKEITFPDFDLKNKVAAEYAKSGVTKSQLLKEAKSAREELITAMNKMSEEKLEQPIFMNGESHCPRTGMPYSLFFIMEEHSEHDTYHQKQIIPNPIFPLLKPLGELFINSILYEEIIYLSAGRLGK